MKFCSKCKIEKEDKAFAKDNTKKSGLSSQCKICKDIYIVPYRDSIKEQRREIEKQRYQQNRENLLLNKKKYYKENKETIVAKTVNRTRVRRGKDIQFKLRENLRTRLYNALRKNAKVGSAVRDLGCSISELKAYLESKFQPGMTWENYGKNGWEIDHIKPLILFNLTERNQFLEACHFSNLQPLWAPENYSKGAKYG